MPPLSLAAALKGALDDEPTRSARRQRAGIGYYVRPSIENESVRSGGGDHPLVLQGQRSSAELAGARDRVVDIVENRARIAAEHDVLAVVGQDDLPAAGQARAADQDLEVRFITGRVERDRAGVLDRAADRQDRAVADRHRPGIGRDRLRVEYEIPCR